MSIPAMRLMISVFVADDDVHRQNEQPTRHGASLLDASEEQPEHELEFLIQEHEVEQRKDAEARVVNC